MENFQVGPGFDPRAVGIEHQSRVIVDLQSGLQARPAADIHLAFPYRLLCGAAGQAKPLGDQLVKSHGAAPRTAPFSLLPIPANPHLAFGPTPQAGFPPLPEGEGSEVPSPAGRRCPPWRTDEGVNNPLHSLARLRIRQSNRLVKPPRSRLSARQISSKLEESLGSNG